MALCHKFIITNIMVTNVLANVLLYIHIYSQFMYVVSFVVYY